MRIRQRGSLGPQKPLFYNYYSGYYKTTTVVPNNYGNSGRVGKLEWMRDDGTRIAKGQVVNKPMDIRRAEYSRIDGDGAIVQGKVLYGTPPEFDTWTRDGNHFETFIPTPTGAYINHPFSTSFPVQEMVDEVSTKVLADRGSSDSNLYESMAQISQTLDLLKSPVKHLFRLYKKAEHELKSSRKGNYRRDLGNVSDTPLSKTYGAANKGGGLYLSYRYGILPLLRDIESIMKGLKSRTGTVRKTTRASLEDSYSSNTENTIVRDELTLVVGIQKTDYVKVRAYSYDEYVADLGNNLGFTTKGFLRVPWEIIPLSFVEDWFTNFSDYLYAFAPVPGYKMLSSGVSITRQSSLTYNALKTSITPAHQNGLTLIRPVSGSYTYRVFSKVRTPGLQFPTLNIKHDFKFDKATRIADAIALLGQLTKGKLFR